MSSKFARISSFLGSDGVVGSCVFVLWSGVGDCLRAVVGVDVSGCRLSLLLSGGPESMEVALYVIGVVLC